MTSLHPLKLGKQTLDWGRRTYVMGILNITPDSFSGDGLLADSPDKALEKAVETAGKFLENGVDILDVGGESTRPGAQPVSADQEVERVLPVVQAIIEKYPDALVSIDTSKSAVATQALQAGARMINDVWGLRLDPNLAQVAARHKAALVLMHNRSNPSSVETREKLGSAYAPGEYQDLLEDVKRELMESVSIARAAGVADEYLILDPGIGFGKSVVQNLELINHLDDIRSLGFPILLGPSRKSFIGYTLDLPPDQRLEGTAAAVAVGIVRGVDIVRVHDVQVMVRISRMTDAIVRPPLT